MNQRLRRSPPDVVYTPIDVTSIGATLAMVWDDILLGVVGTTAIIVGVSYLFNWKAASAYPESQDTGTFRLAVLLLLVGFLEFTGVLVVLAAMGVNRLEERIAHYFASGLESKRMRRVRLEERGELSLKNLERKTGFEFSQI